MAGKEGKFFHLDGNYFWGWGGRGICAGALALALLTGGGGAGVGLTAGFARGQAFARARFPKWGREGGGSSRCGWSSAQASLSGVWGPGQAGPVFF